MARLETTAVHEAGHAVMTLVEGRRFSHVDVVARGNVAGAVHDTVTRRGDDEDVRIKLAGVMAQRFCGRRWHARLSWGAEGDFIGIADFLRTHPRAAFHLDWNVEATSACLLERWATVERVARARARERRLEYEQVLAIYSSTSELSGRSPPGLLEPKMWEPLKERIRWHSENPGGLAALVARARAQAQAASLDP